MQARFRIHFVDGSHEELDATDANAAKLAAKNKRAQAIGAAGALSPADLAKHGAVKVAKVEELSA